MNTALKRRLERLETIASRSKGAGSTATLIEPGADASEEQWRQFVVFKAAAEAAGRGIVAIRSVQPIAYRGRVVIVPPKIPAIVQVSPLPREENSHAY